MGLNLLHIEDSVMDAHLINKSLCNIKNSNEDYKIKHVLTLHDALFQLKEGCNYNAILLDLGLPDGQGVKNIEVIKTIQPNIPIIVVTGENDEGTALLALGEGAQEYIVKAHSNGPIIQRIVQSSIFRKQAELVLSHKVNHDVLTGLPNRSFFEKAVTGMIARAKRTKKTEALMFIDLNEFKEINDTLGHEAGNVVLKTVATRLINAMRSTDLIARYAGDEFVVYMDSGNSPVNELLCLHVAKKIVREVEKPIIINGETLEVSLSIGIALFPDAGDSFNMLLKNADKAMYEAKRNPDKKYSIIGKINSYEKEKKLKKIISTPINQNKAQKNLLIIDDSPQDCKIYRGMLTQKRAFFNVMEAHSIKQGMKLLQKHSFDCILLDHDLPGETGLQFLMNCKATGQYLDIPVIMLTGRDDRETAVFAIRHGAQDFIVKDEIHAEYLLSVIKAQIEKKDLKQQLKSYQEDLKRSHKYLSSFSHTVAHDLKAPIKKIKMFCAILAEKVFDSRDEEIKSCIDRISLNSERMHMLVHTLLDYGQIINGRETKEVACLKKVMDAIIEEMSLEQGDIKLCIKSLPKWSVYPVQIKQLLTNLISNAIKYQSQDRKLVLMVSSQVKKDICIISVQDNGIGIDSEYIPDIFEPFYRLHAADDIEGTGLGLAICSKIAQNHDGTLGVDSEIGIGSSFTFTLSS